MTTAAAKKLTRTMQRPLPCRPPTIGNGLDQFYTKPAVARKCFQVFERVAKKIDFDTSRCWYVEPSAGCGCFYQTLPPRRRTGIDIEPRKLPRINGAGILQADYLNWQPAKTKTPRRYVVIGNPPFGRRGKMAVAFFNQSAFADIIAFIVPVTFRKYFIHKQLQCGYALVKRYALPNDAFHLPDGKSYEVNAEFQVWTRLPAKLKNLREHSPPPISHPDFAMRQYNNTQGALPAFDARFDFAVPCQGYQDYTRREYNSSNCEKNKQWLLFIAKNKRIRRRLLTIDFGALAAECATSTPGFRKNDVVRHYETLV